MLLARNFDPVRLGRRHEHVAVRVLVDFGQLEAGRVFLEPGEDLGPADHRDVAVAGQLQRFLDRMRDFGALGLPVAVAGQHDVAAARQRLGEAVEGLAAHDHRRAHGQRA